MDFYITTGRHLVLKASFCEGLVLRVTIMTAHLKPAGDQVEGEHGNAMTKVVGPRKRAR